MSDISSEREADSANLLPKRIVTKIGVKFLPRFIKRSRYVEVSCKPGITLTFTPLTTTIYAQTHYATGSELKVMKEVIEKIENYLLLASRATFNIITFK